MLYDKTRILIMLFDIIIIQKMESGEAEILENEASEFSDAKEVAKERAFYWNPEFSHKMMIISEDSTILQTKLTKCSIFRSALATPAVPAGQITHIPMIIRGSSRVKLGVVRT